MKKALRNIAFVTLFAALLVPATAFAKGPIVIKTLPYTISVPGNYTLATNLTYTADLADAITISASNVTLDLNGFGITGPGKATSSYSAITITGNGVEVKNGYMTGFCFGLRSFDNVGSKASNLKMYENSNGIYASTSYGADIRDCFSYNNDQCGFLILSAGSIIENNIAYNNGTVGIYVAESSSVIGNNSYGNSAMGIYATHGCTVKNNSSCENNSLGIYATEDVLDGNAATGNNGGGANYFLGGSSLGTNTP